MKAADLRVGLDLGVVLKAYWLVCLHDLYVWNWDTFHLWRCSIMLQNGVTQFRGSLRYCMEFQCNWYCAPCGLIFRRIFMRLFLSYTLQTVRFATVFPHILKTLEILHVGSFLWEIMEETSATSCRSVHVLLKCWMIQFHLSSFSSWHLIELYRCLFSGMSE